MSSWRTTPSHYASSEAKRRKVRKGTHSCWECKRRKMKCVFSPITNATCIGCERRGSSCVSQEFSEDVSLAGDQARHLESGIATAGTRQTDPRREIRMRSTANGRSQPNGSSPATPMGVVPSQYLAFYRSPQVGFLGNDAALCY
jgi:hypothetical protein